MMFSKLSILIAAWAALTVAALPQTTQKCPNGNGVLCCTTKRAATSDDKSLADKNNLNIQVGAQICTGCTDLSSLESQGRSCDGQKVCYEKVASDIAIGCTNV